MHHDDARVVLWLLRHETAPFMFDCPHSSQQVEMRRASGSFAISTLTSGGLSAAVWAFLAFAAFCEERRA